MEVASATQVRYSPARVLSFLHNVEAAYNVSLKFWVVGGKPADLDPDMGLCCWGSGDAFDLIPEGIAPRPMTIYSDESECIEEALYWAISFVERQLNRVREPLGPRPVL